MKMSASIALGVGILLMTACSTKSSSYSQKTKTSSERSIASKNSKESKAAALTATSHSCQRAEDHRQIFISPTSAGGCQVDYQKAGGKQTIAEAKNDLNYCGQVKDRVVQNLQQAGFQCESQVAGANDSKASN